MIYMNGLGDSTPIEGTTLPSSELLLSDNWGTSVAPTIPTGSKKAKRSFARPPVSPSLLETPPSEQFVGPVFPPPTKGGEVILGFIPLPTWMPKWAAYGVGLAVLAFGADYAYRHFFKGGGGRLLATNPKGRRRRVRVARLVEGDDDDVDDMESDLVERAREFREKFHWGIPGRKVRRRKVASPPRVATKLGELVNVTYKTKKRGEKAQHFIHEFGEEGGRRPTLAMDIENKKLHIVGGDYDVTADGIKD